MDKNVEDLIGKYKARAKKGLKKYGVTTERMDIDLKGWLKHLLEELMDATVYIQRILAEIDDITVVDDYIMEMAFGDYDAADRALAAEIIDKYLKTWKECYGLDPVD